MSRPLITVDTHPRRRSESKAPVISRLQGLFPRNGTPTTKPSTPTVPLSSSASHAPSHNTQSQADMLRSLKIRIVTWNMHESVPKGDLEELFGKVPVYTPPSPPLDSSVFPQFSMDDMHPYHLVVVAGQECPSVSGIPMGLGAGFKLKDKEKEDKSELSRHKSKHSLHDSELSLRSREKEAKDSHEGAPSGWTQMIEDWLCHAAGSRTRSLSSPVASDIGVPKPLAARTPLKEAKKGPYQLLVKERMMGIYMAIYVHRDVRSYIKGSSKSAVTAGLIGGRLGNKGGVGISLDVDGTTLLFMNCHLAAHEGRVAHRLANLAKIKSELSVDDFLSPHDSRIMAEDLTDKFDFSFLFGDLNFRLDIQRLHADWLISRKDYAQALTFDQLLKLMEEGKEFAGFKEGKIDFPPTFKYDVLRTLKGSRRLHLSRWKSQGGHDHAPITEVHERGDKSDEDSDGDEGEGEGASIASSTWTSVNSRMPTENDGEDDDFFSSTNTPVAASSKLSLSTAAVKVKSKWLSVISSSGSSPSSPAKKWFQSSDQSLSNRSPSTKSKRHHNHKHSNSLDAPAGPTKSTTALVVDRQKKQQSSRSLHGPERAWSMENLASGPGLLQPPPSMERTMSTRSAQLASSDDETSDVETDKGVYDSSSKRRVPSWCDRILFESTVYPDSEDEDSHDESSTRRGKVMHFFSNAFKSRRRASQSSLTVSSTLTPDTGSTVAGFDNTPVATPRSEESKSYEREPTSPRMLRRSSSYDGHVESQARAPERRPRRSLTHPEEDPEELSTRRHGIAIPSDQPPQLPNISTNPTGWRFWPSFLTNHSNTGIGSRTNTISSSPAPIIPLPPPPPPLHRKGDVVCLKYDTLDDRGMRRLEGRSDHRPVIGSYAVFI